MRPIPATRLGDAHGLIRAIEQRGRLRTDELVTEFSLGDLFPPGLENALGRMRHFISYARSAGLVKEDRGVVELTDVGRRYIRAADPAAFYDVSPQQAEWLRRQLREKHMTDSIYHGLAIGLSLLASVPPGAQVATLDFGRSMAYLGRAGWDNENTLQIQGERHVILLGDMELLDAERRLTPTGHQLRSELTLPIHMSLLDLAAQLNPGGAAAVGAAAAAEFGGAPEPEPPPPAHTVSEAGPPADDDEDDNGYHTAIGLGAAPSQPPVVPRASEPLPERPTEISPPVRPAPPGPPPVAVEPPANVPPPEAPAGTPPPVAAEAAMSTAPPVPAPAEPQPPTGPHSFPPPAAEPAAGSAPPQAAAGSPAAPAADVAPPRAVEPAVGNPPTAAPAPSAASAPPHAEPAVEVAPAPAAGSPPTAAPAPSAASAPPHGEPAATSPPTTSAPSGASAPPYPDPGVDVPPAPAAEPAEVDVGASVPPPAVAPPRREELGGGGFVDARAIREAADEAGLQLPAGVYANVAAALAAGRHLLLTGAPGAGKTALALAVARAAAQGGRAQGATVVTAGGEPAAALVERVVEAARRGRWLVLDELDRGEPEATLGPLTTFLGGLPVALAGKEVAPAADWRMVATWAGPLPAPSVLRRFAVVDVVAPPSAALRAALREASQGDPIAAAAIERLLPLAGVAPVGAGLFVVAARHAAARNAAAPTDQATLAREAYAAYLAPLLGEARAAADDRLRELLAGA